MKLWQPRSAASRLVRPGQYAAGGMGPGRQLPINFDGPNIGAQAWTVGVAIAPIDCAFRFTVPPPGVPAYALFNAPPGIVIDAGTGRISGTPTTAGSWPDCVVRCDAAGGRNAYSNTFTATVA